MKSGIAIVEIWEKKTHVHLECFMKEFLIELIETGLNEAYLEGQNRVMELMRKKVRDEKQ